jgi:outer membrane protein OmpA-like peptidoglycan-associated protein
MLRSCAIVLLLALPTVAAAQQPQISVKPQFKPGEPIAVAVTSPVAAVRFDLSLDHEGKPVQVAHGPARAGEHVLLKLPGPGHYEGKLVVTFRDGNRTSTDLQFQAVVAGGTMSLGYAREHLDLDAHRLEFTLTRPAGRASLKVVGEDGNELATASADFHGERPGTWLPISWSPSSAGEPFKLVVTATSADGVSVVATLVPWSVAVPHTEVVFETGKADIRPSEEPKLDAGYKKIVDEVSRARKAAPDLQVKLFVAGHTDTVGGNADNRKLSLARAKAIGAWFRDRGLPLPISYAGFGEEALKVKTPDETDSAANRRADYIVAFEEPQVARGVHATWMKLQ